MAKNVTAINLGRLLQDFFYKRLIQQRRVSPLTIASYRDTFRLLLRFAEQKLCKSITKMGLSDLNTSLVLNFLDHLEIERKNSVRSRNVRLAAIRSFLHYAGLQEPGSISGIQKIFSIPIESKTVGEI